VPARPERSARQGQGPGGAIRARETRGHGPAGIPAGAAAVTATGLVMALVMAVRLWPLLRHHVLGGLLENDDGVYYNAAAHLAAGRLPYRAFAFLQPPGIAVLLTPFAALARVMGDPAAMSAARLGIVLVAAVNAALLMRLMRCQAGPVAAAAAGITYAVWGGAADTERTVLIEPLLGLTLLTALAIAYGRRGAAPAPGRPGWRLAAAGGVLGFGMALKTWAVVDVVVLSGWAGWQDGRRPGAGAGWAAGLRAAGLLLGGALAVATAVCLPFFAAAPRAVLHDVVTVQLHRSVRFATTPMMFLHDLTGVGLAYSARGAGLAAVSAVIAAGAAAVAVTLSRGPRVWAVLAIAQVALVAPQTTFTYHYTDFAAPAVAACAGAAAARLARAVRRPGGWRARAGVAVCAAAGAAAAAALAGQSVSVAYHPGAQATLASFFAAHPCAFADYPSVLAYADAETRQVRLGCGNLVDYSGAALAASGGPMLAPGTGYRAPAWQAQVRAILQRSDAAVLLFAGNEAWTPRTSALFDSRFRRAGRAGRFSLWIRRTRRAGHTLLTRDPRGVLTLPADDFAHGGMQAHPVARITRRPEQAGLPAGRGRRFRRAGPHRFRGAGGLVDPGRSPSRRRRRFWRCWRRPGLPGPPRPGRPQL
jgi:alpha-1,2-mannosyltransferase